MQHVGKSEKETFITLHCIKTYTTSLLLYSVYYLTYVRLRQQSEHGVHHKKSHGCMDDRKCYDDNGKGFYVV